MILKVTSLLDGHKKDMNIMFRVTLIPSLTFTITSLYFVRALFIRYLIKILSHLDIFKIYIRVENEVVVRLTVISYWLKPLTAIA
jgi:hypothetical protein